MAPRTDALQSLADARAERHAQTFTAGQVPYDEHVHRLLLDGYNAHQIAHLTRKPMIDVRLILAGIERDRERAWLEARAGRCLAVTPQTEVTTRVKRAQPRRRIA